VFCITLKYIKDSREMPVYTKGIKGFVVDMKEIIIDTHSRWVFGYAFVVMLGMAMMSTLQMYLYEHFMRFGGTQKTIAHGGGMVGLAFGSLLAVTFVRWFDKKGAVVFGCVINVVCNLILALLFLSGLLKPS
jgi:Na+/melibiose symporter-like transporter